MFELTTLFGTKENMISFSLVLSKIQRTNFHDGTVCTHPHQSRPLTWKCLRKSTKIRVREQVLPHPLFWNINTHSIVLRHQEKAQKSPLFLIQSPNRQVQDAPFVWSTQVLTYLNISALQKKELICYTASFYSSHPSASPSDSPADEPTFWTLMK